MVSDQLRKGIDAMEIYTYKVHDWRLSGVEAKHGRPAFRELSMKYNPAILRTVSRAINRLKH